MKPETEQLLRQCRSALLQQSNEQLNTLFVSLCWLVGVSVPKLRVDNGCPDYFGYLLPEIERQSGSIPSSLFYSPIGEMSIRVPDHCSSPLLDQIP